MNQKLPPGLDELYGEGKHGVDALRKRKVATVDKPKAGYYMVHFDDGTSKLLTRFTKKLGILNKPALLWWAANIERDYVIEKAKDVFTRRVSFSAENAPAFEKALREELGEKKAHQMRLKEAGAIGTALHLLVQNELRAMMGQSIEKKPGEDQSALLAFLAWEDWKASVELEPTHVETRLASERLDVGGTMDCVGWAFNPEMDGKKTHTLFDWKTAARSKTAPNGIYPESEIQVCVYRAMAIEMGMLDDDSWAAVVRLPKTESDPCLALNSPEPFDVKWIDPERADYLARGFEHISKTFSFMQSAFPK